MRLQSIFIGPLYLALALGTSACCTTGRTGPEAPKCSANGSPNSETVLSSACNFVVQTDQVCVYDGEGMLKEVASRAAGPCICLGTDF
jgi:hypothetical protein